MLDDPKRRQTIPSAQTLATGRTAVLAPRATYRLQFHEKFPFSAGTALASYLGDLGVSHVYSSPILTARAGSMHGYDVVDYDAISPELGGEADFVAMAKAFRDKGIGIILDIVPNHMAVGGADNRLWLDLLKHGRGSRYATWFDVDFDCPDEGLTGRVHAPFLGQPYADVLAAGELKLVACQIPTLEGYAIAYGEHLFPIRPETDAEIEAAGIEAYRDPDRLDQLIGRQHYLLDWWRNAGDRINWRRFFDVTQLAAVRMEVPAAFAAKHAVPFRLYRDGLIDGLRIDHIDGLADPAGYCRELRHHLDELQSHRPSGLADERAYVIVEKILAPGEAIPADWDVQGSTGYDFMNEVSALQHDPDATLVLGEHWAGLSGRPRDFAAEEDLARHQVLDAGFDGQRRRFIDLILTAGAEHREGAGLTEAALRRAATSLIAEMHAYRSYATGRGDGVGIGDRLEAALKSALAAPLCDPPALNFIASVLKGEGDEALRPVRMEAIRRFNQLTAPLAAKAVEDTAFYRYGRLLSRNDVGFDASVLGLETDDFHALMQVRADTVPNGMLTTATHDHKRGEDVRARLAVISELPAEFIAATLRWRGLVAGIQPESLDPGDVYMLYQMLVGAWDLELQPDDTAGLQAYAERLSGWARKALREGKLRSSWTSPNEAYEQAFLGFIDALLSPSTSSEFLKDLTGFVARIAAPGAANGLVQTALRCLAPGLPDTYQGTEFWDFSLVDPDNRRPVDFPARQAALASAQTLSDLAANWRDGRVKQALLRQLLQLRAGAPDLFAHGTYEPLTVTGRRQRNVVAFQRCHEGKSVVVIAARLIADGLTSKSLVPEADWWDDTKVVGLPQHADSVAVIGQSWPGGADIQVASLLGTLPIAVCLFGRS